MYGKSAKRLRWRDLEGLWFQHGLALIHTRCAHTVTAATLNGTLYYHSHEQHDIHGLLKQDPPFIQQDPNPSGSGLGLDPADIGHGVPHDNHFFEATPKNVKASNLIAAYADWIKGVDKNSTAWEERLSEPDFFAKSVLEWPEDVSCGVAYNGCDGRPLCDDISERIENRTRARQICYVFNSFHHVSLISAQVHVGVHVLFDVLVKLTVFAGTKQSSPSRR